MIVKPNEETAKEKYDGQDWAFGNAFVDQHLYEFGFTLDERDIIVDDVRVRGIGKSFYNIEKTVDQQLATLERRAVDDSKVHSRAKVYYEGGRLDTPIYKLADLDVGDEIKGPAMLADGTQTIVVTPKATAVVIDTHVVIDVEKEAPRDE
jgi:5-oxoprolinase (ATP-hydrolysing)